MSRQSRAHLQRPLWTAQLLLCPSASVEMRFWLRAGRKGAGKPGPDLEVDPGDGQRGQQGLCGERAASRYTYNLSEYVFWRIFTGGFLVLDGLLWRAKREEQLKVQSVQMSPNNGKFVLPIWAIIPRRSSGQQRKCTWKSFPQHPQAQPWELKAQQGAVGSIFTVFIPTWMRIKPITYQSQGDILVHH